MIIEELHDEYSDFDRFLFESAVSTWGRSGDKILKKYRCTAGPRTGRIVSKPGDCGKRLDVGRRQKMKNTQRRMGKRIARKASRTKRMSPISKRLRRQNRLLRNDQYTDMQLNEYNVIGSAIHKDKIPRKYRNMKLIGRGATSLVFDYDENNVLVLTRDAIKQEWIERSGLGRHIEDIESDHPIKQIAEKPVSVYKMEKLEPLSKENKKKVKKIIHLLEQERFAIVRKQMSGNQWKQEYADKMANMLDMDFHDQESLRDFFNFIMDYDPSQYHFDLLFRNFMQNKQGEIIAVDPVADAEIVNAFMNKYK